MTICKDPLVEFLKDFGYCLVKYPKSDLQPLRIFEKSNIGLTDAGNLKDIFEESDQPIPSIHKNKPRADISNIQSAFINFNTGFNFLKDFLQAMSCLTIGLDLAFNKANAIQFEFNNVKEDYLEPAKLDIYLRNTPTKESGYIAKMKDEKIYIITSVLKCESFTISLQDKSKSFVKVELPEIKDIIKGDVKLTTKGDNTEKVSFDGEVSLAFAAKLHQVLFIENNFTLKPVEGKVLKSEDDFPGNVYTTDEPVVDI
jgi:hypothetical protein